MYLVILIGLGILLALFPTFRCVVFHPVSLPFYGVKDFIEYIGHQRWNECHTGELVAYTGLFGKGKTLSAVHKVTHLYARYNGKRIWDSERKRWAIQRVKVLSNVALQIPYEELRSLSQMVFCAQNNARYDDDHGTVTVTLVLGDEFSVQMNSRNFKSNIDGLFLNTLLTCRHYHLSLYYTAQRFAHVDALIRQVTANVVECNKLWRFQRQSVYSGWEMENAVNPELVTPIAKTCWFVRNSDYRAYDTLATVGNLAHSCAAGDMLSEDEILALRRNDTTANMDGVRKPVRAWRKSRKK